MRMRWIVAVFLSFAGVALPIARATADDLPRGPWRMDCRRPSMDGTILTASCPDPTGAFVQSSIQSRLCASGIQNVRGQLRCRPDPVTPPPADTTVTGGALPRGPWRLECRRASMDGTILTASCPDPTGAFVQSSIQTRLCKSGIQNVRGQLRCQPDPVTPAPDQTTLTGGSLPRGPWRSECRRASLDGTILTASCPDGRGNFVRSSIQTRLCASGIQNVRGQLRCQPQPATPPLEINTGLTGPPLPRGPWRADCRRPSMNGTILTAQCPNRSGRYVPSSIQTRLCTAGIQNVGGQLRCVAPPAPVPPSARPQTRPPPTRTSRPPTAPSRTSEPSRATAPPPPPARSERPDRR